MYKVNKKFSNIRKIYRDLIYTFIIGVVLFFLAMVISFVISKLIPADPVLVFLPEGRISPELYWVIYRMLGLDKPLIEQFFIYIERMFTGNWGVSGYISRSDPTIDLIIPSLKPTFDLILPLCVGIILGISLGKHSVRTKHKWKEKSIQILALIGLAIPYFSLCMLFQYILGYVFPTIGIASIMTILTRLNILNKYKSRSIVPNSFNIGISFSAIFTYIIFTETIFDTGGLTHLLYLAIRNTDYYLIDAISFLILISSAILIVLGNLIFILRGAYKNIQDSNRSITKKVNKGINNPKQGNSGRIDISTKPKKGFKTQFKDFRKWLYKRLVSPFTIIGSVMLLFFILISIFPQILTPYSIQEANGVYIGAWNPPSPDHPLGTTIFGRDVLARIVYGIQNSLLFLLVPITVGLIGGLVFGIPIGLLNRRFKIRSEISMIAFFISPTSILYILYYIASYNHLFLLVNYGLFLIPFFTLLIAKTRLNGFEIMKKVIPSIPLLTGFILLVQSGMAFLGFSDPILISLGADIREVIGWLDSAPHAFIFHSLFLFLLIMGFFLLYIGLQKTSQEKSLASF